MCAVFCYAGYWSIRFAYADHFAAERTRPSIERAISLASASSEYYVRLAEADSRAALPAMERAAALNPLNSSVWIEFAQVAEEHKDLELAEACLLRAAKVDKTFAPRWLLAEYYGRRGDQEKFWPAMRVALATSYDDVTPLFDTCWRLAPIAGTILGLVIPDRADVERQYLDYVLAKKRLDLALPVALRLMAHANVETVPSLLAYCDRLLEKNEGRQALKIWNSLSSQRLLNYPPLVPENGVSITNGGFEKPFLAEAFDWRLFDLPGVTARRIGSPAMLRLSFSGKQPETCEILSQFVPLLPEKDYRLSILYETSGLEGETGLTWGILDAAGGMTASQKNLELTFHTTAETQLGRLVLSYHRVLGTVRIEGDILLRNVKLALAE